MSRLGRLHLITDTRAGRDPLPVIRAALRAAVAADATGDLVVQVRVQDTATDREAYGLTVAVLGLCRLTAAVCLVNDRLHVGLAAGAAGGHVGADDLPPVAARRVLGPDAILGVTARTPIVARAAVHDGASYLGVGPCHPTSTKDGLPAPIGVLGLGRVAGAVPGTPVVAIGGVTAARVPHLLAAGAYGVAVVGALSDAADPEQATTRLLRALGPAPEGQHGAPTGDHDAPTGRHGAPGPSPSGHRPPAGAGGGAQGGEAGGRTGASE